MIVTMPDVLGLAVLLAAGAVVVALLTSGGLVHALMRPPRKTYAVALGRGLPTDPGEMGLNFDPVTFTLGDGSETPGWIIAGQAGGGPTAVVVHGFGDSRYGSLTWAPLLVPHVSRLVLYDLRGHGEATSRNAHCGTTDVTDLLHILEQIDLAGAIVLFGYSMGGGIAIAAAAAAGEDRREASGARLVSIAGVIADGPYQRWDEPIRAYLRARRYPVWPTVPLAEAGLRLLMPDFSPDRFDRAVHAGRLRCPLLILHGDQDHLCPLASAEALAAAAAQGELVRFPTGGHLDLAAVDEPRYREALDRFFSSLSHHEPRIPDRSHESQSRGDAG